MGVERDQHANDMANNNRNKRDRILNDMSKCLTCWVLVAKFDPYPDHVYALLLKRLCANVVCTESLFIAHALDIKLQTYATTRKPSCKLTPACCHLVPLRAVCIRGYHSKSRCLLSDFHRQ